MIEMVCVYNLVCYFGFASETLLRSQSTETPCLSNHAARPAHPRRASAAICASSQPCLCLCLCIACHTMHVSQTSVMCQPISYDSL